MKLQKIAATRPLIGLLGRPVGMEPPEVTVSSEPQPGPKHRLRLVTVVLALATLLTGGGIALWTRYPGQAPVVTSARLPWLSGTMAGDPGEAASWAAFRGRPVDIAVDYLPRERWAFWDDPISFFEKYAGWQGQVSVSLAPFPADGSNYAGLSVGLYDQHFVNFGREMVAAGHADWPIRLAWEADGDWLPWGVGNNAHGTADDFKNGFRRAVIAIRQGNPQAIIDLTLGADAYNRLWPGDSYVDIVGTDYYDMSALRGDFKKVAEGPKGINTGIAFARAHKKKFSVAEWGVVSQVPYGGGDNPSFIQGMYDTFKANADVIAYEAYFSSAAEGDVKSSLVDPNQNPRSSALYRRLW